MFESENRPKDIMIEAEEELDVDKRPTMANPIKDVRGTKVYQMIYYRTCETMK